MIFWWLMGHSWGLNGRCLDSSSFRSWQKRQTENKASFWSHLPFHPLCSVRNWEPSQVFATRPFLPGLAESVAKSSAVLDGSGNYRARTCRISNIVKCFITASKCFMLRKKCKQWPAITLSLQSSQDHFANMETFNDHISQWSNRELRAQSKMIQTISCTYWAYQKTQSISWPTGGFIKSLLADGSWQRRPLRSSWPCLWPAWSTSSRHRWAFTQLA